MSGPAHGALTGAAPDVTYTPAGNYHGTDSFTFTAHDGKAASAPATVSITVTPVNEPPVAADGTAYCDRRSVSGAASCSSTFFFHNKVPVSASTA